MQISQIKTNKIVILAYPGVQMAAALGLADLFEIANRIQGNADTALEITMAKIEDLPMDPVGAIIVPPNINGGRGDDASALPIHIWLCAQHRQGAVICSACAGAFWLGHAGLLDGRPTTTHWALADEFAATFPKTHVEPEHLLIDDGDIVTAGGLMAWIDLGLFLTELWLGPSVMSATARHLLVDPSGREQRNYRNFRPPLDHGDGAILALQHWLEANMAAALNIRQIAQKAAMSERSLLRRFKQATGHPPARYLQELRVEKARGLLERSRIPIADVGYRVGYLDPSAFGRVFKASTGLTAADYARRFTSLRTRNPMPK